MTTPNLRRRISLGAIGAAVAAAVLGSAIAPAEAQERVRWRVPIAFPSALPALGDTAPWVFEQLNIVSGGNVQLRISEPGQLVPPFQIMEAVKDRKVQAGFTWIGYDAGKIPALPLISAVPFGMEPWAFTAWWYHAGGKELGQELYEPHNIHPLLCGIISPETAGWFRFEITSLDDVRGLKIRFAGLGGKILQELGASVTEIPGAEIYQALERGAIDAAEFSLPEVDQQLGFDRVAKYNYFPGWHQTFTTMHLLVNKGLWDGLEEQTQALMNMACMAGTMYGLSKAEANQGPVIAQFPDKGVTPVVLPEEILLELEQVSTQVLREEAEKDEMFSKILESQIAFRKNYDLWKQYGYLPRDFPTTLYDRE
ncbi:MAG: TRAP transporter substrate-binding protein [Rhodospirillales bacterium]|nr:MAG: TRAP transporter substrate-binding protein [Rhodospirillales bacterium]